MSEIASCTVLNVDDNEAIRYARTRALEQLGYRVVEAGTGSEALELLRRERPALVVLDVKLPDMSGLDISQQIKNNPDTADTLVLQISAYHTSSSDRAMGLERGADSYLTEPVTREEFLASIRALLRLRSREKEYKSVMQDLKAQENSGRELWHAGQRERETREQIRHLASKLGVVKEQERQKLAQSLHDDLAQLLVVARLKLHQQSHRPAEQSVKEIDAVLDQCLTYTRSLMSDLMPPDVYEGRLDVGLRWLAAPMQEHGLKVSVELPNDPVTIHPDTAMTLVKCARELLFNVLKHSGTREAFISMTLDQGLIRIAVLDRGQGCPDLSPSRSMSHTFGLFSVQQRLELLGGRLEILSQSGAGTRATLIVPYQPATTQAYRQ